MDHDVVGRGRVDGCIRTAVSPDATLAAFSSTETGPVLTIADTTSGAVLHRFENRLVE